MNQKKLNIYKEVLWDADVAFKGGEKIINERIQGICSREKLSVEEVIYFIYILLLSCL